jgi:hypothetical protein
VNINEEMIAGVAAMVAKRKLIDETLKAELKQAYPDTRFTLCSDDDIHAGKPVLEKENFAIYLVGSSDHCLTLTNDYDLATGVVIAEVFDD